VKEVLRTNDIALLSFVDALLSDSEIPHVLADAYMSVMEGSLEHFPDKWIPLFRKKMRPNKDLEPRSDAIRTEKALGVLPRRVLVNNDDWDEAVGLLRDAGVEAGSAHER
jgi:hypothetical protein